MSDKIVIIGGGVAGLACGCYLRMNGYPAEILEANPLPGGLCTAWDRGPYVFDGCLRWLVGTRPASAFHQVWTELGAIAGRPVINCDEFLRFEAPGGQVLSLSADLDQLAQNLRRAAPEDAARIDKLVRAARRCAFLEPPLENPLELMTAAEKTRLLFRYLPLILTITKWRNRSLGAYLSTYRSQLLRDALLAIAGDPRMSALVLVMVLAFRTQKNADYVTGGSRAFAQAIARRYAQLGGFTRYNTPVASITVDRDRATGVRCADGTLVPAAAVVSCVDGHTTIFKLLEGRYVSRSILRTYEQGELFPGLVQVSLGVTRTFPEALLAISLPLAEPLVTDGLTRHDRVEVGLFGPDSGLCPPARSVIIVRFSNDYAYWADLRRDHPADYARAKENLLREITAILEQRFPGLARQIEHADVATPATFARYTGNRQASYQGWLPTPQILHRPFPRTLPGLKDFYMAGHWVSPGGGLPPAALSGRYVAQMICARDGKAFTAASA